MGSGPTGRHSLYKKKRRFTQIAHIIKLRQMQGLEAVANGLFLDAIARNTTAQIS
jgi:hypothetical protein